MPLRAADFESAAFASFATIAGTHSLLWGSNPRPPVYKTGALPLS